MRVIQLPAKTNGNSIFLPAAGIRLNDELDNAGSYSSYWPSSLLEGNQSWVWELFYQSIDIDYGKFLVSSGNGHYPIDSKNN